VDFGDKKVTGWAGIMRRGSHVAAGFSVFRRRRLIEGSVGETYKPSLIFGNPNTFASQRVVGELFVEGFDVTHTKDGIQWHGYEDELLESIRRQIDAPDLPILDQANGYRARKTADQLPPTFGADALSDTAEALTQTTTLAALREQTAVHAAEPEATYAVALPVLQQKDLILQIDRDGKPWKVHLELVRDPVAPFYKTALEVRNGEDVVTVQLNLDHDFSVSFINDNEGVLQPIMRLIAALSLGERLARDAGVKNAGTVRVQANQILRSLASDRGH
jgi:hypothetical protein